MKFLHFLDVGKVVHVAIAKPKYLCTWNFPTTIATFLIFQPKKSFFENSLNTFEDIAFLLGQCKGKIEIFHFLDVGKVVTLLLRKPKYLCTLKFSTTIATFLCLSAKKIFFENSLNTFEVIAFLLGQCKGKNWNFSFSGCWKSCAVAIAKAKWLCTWNFQPQ